MFFSLYQIKHFQLFQQDLRNGECKIPYRFQKAGEIPDFFLTVRKKYPDNLHRYLYKNFRYSRFTHTPREAFGAAVSEFPFLNLEKTEALEGAKILICS